jgi:hypothetical protein
MKTMIKRGVMLGVLTLAAIPAFAESSLEEYFYASGKIKVVIAVASIVLAGLVAYVIILDKKVKNLEKKK